MNATAIQDPLAIKVTLLTRRPLLGQYSVERAFGNVVGALPSDIDASLVQVPYESRGFLSRLGNLLFTARVRADVIHITGDIHYCALAVRPRRCVLTVLDLVSLRRLTGWRRRVIQLFWYRLPVRRAGAVTVISDAVCSELLALIPAAGEKTTVIGVPVGVDLEPVEQGSIGTERFRVLQVGTGANKNLLRVATAIADLPIHLHVIGRLNEDQRGALDRLDLSYSQEENLTDTEIRDAYRQSSMVVFASTYEGFGLPIVEAQACGVPVVTSAIPPMCDVAGGAAILVDPHDVTSIRVGVEELMNDAERRSLLIEAGLLNAARYSPAQIAAAYADTYRRVAGHLGSAASQP